MFDGLKKKLKGLFGKASEAVEQPAAAPAPEEIEKQILGEVKKELAEEAKPPTEGEKVEAEEVKEAILEKFEEKIEEPRPEDFVEKEEVPRAPPEEKEISKEKVPPGAPLPKEKIPKVVEKIEEVAPKFEGKLEEEDYKEPAEEIPETKLFEPKPPAEAKPPEHKPKEVIHHLEEEIVEKKESGILKLFSKITHKELAEKDVAPVLWELEIALLESDVAKEVAEKITAEVKGVLLSKKVKRGTVEEIIKSALKKSANEILGREAPDILGLIEKKKEKPYVILFFGFNGTGKTMTIGKFAKMAKDNGFTAVMAAGDTFRAAAIEQLEVHANNLKVPIVKQKKGADSAAVIFDAIKYAKAHNIDVVLADTAGRSHTNVNLMDELRKIVRVSKPDFKIFVGDSLTGNDAAEQAKLFDDAVGIDGSVLTKVDTDPKGGACLSVAYVTKKPILYLGTGQNYGDMVEFSAKWFLDKVF